MVRIFEEKRPMFFKGEILNVEAVEDAYICFSYGRGNVKERILKFQTMAKGLLNKPQTVHAIIDGFLRNGIIFSKIYSPVATGLHTFQIRFFSLLLEESQASDFAHTVINTAEFRAMPDEASALFIWLYAHPLTSSIRTINGRYVFSVNSYSPAIVHPACGLSCVGIILSLRRHGRKLNRPSCRISQERPSTKLPKQ